MTDKFDWPSKPFDQAVRAAPMGQRPMCIWMTGLSGAGKSTLADHLAAALKGMGRQAFVLDGDHLRHGLNKDLGFAQADRAENVRRVAEVARLMVDAGLVVLVSVISPFREQRAFARSLFAAGDFLEVFVDTPIEVCMRRDPKGLYAKARSGQLKDFTGIDSPYEAPEAPEVHVMAGTTSPTAGMDLVLRRAGLSTGG